MPLTFLVRCSFGRAQVWRETELGYSRDDLIGDLMGAQIDRPTQILELDPDHRHGTPHRGHVWCRDVTTEIAREVMRRLMTEAIEPPECIHGFLNEFYPKEAA